MQDYVTAAVMLGAGMNCYLCVQNGPTVSGRGDWIRTSDPLRPRQVRYQAALRPDLTNNLDSTVFAGGTSRALLPPADGRLSPNS